MINRINQFENEDRERPHCREPQPIGVILSELLAQYQVRFPKVQVTVVETPTGFGCPSLEYGVEDRNQFLSGGV